MENFSAVLPWQVLIVMLLVVMLLYLITALVYYFIATVIAALVSKFIKPKEDKSRNIFQTALPLIIASTIIYWTLIQLSFHLGHGPRPQDFRWGIISTSYFNVSSG